MESQASSTGFLAGMTRWVEEKLAPSVIKFTENKYISAVRQGFLVSIPIMIIGSVFLIIWLFPVKGWDQVLGEFGGYLGTMVSVTFGLLGMVVSFTIAYYLARNLEIEPVLPGIFSLLGFMLLSPPTTLESGSYISTAYLGAPGLFSAIILGLLAPSILHFFTEHRITIRMPEGVPESIVATFASIVPGLVFLTAVWLIRVVLNLDVHAFILKILSPLVVAGDSVWAVNIEVLINRVAWSVGIHGYAVVQSVAAPFWTMAAAANAEAASAGLPIPHIGTSQFLDGLALWSGSTTWPVVAILLFSRLRSFRALGRLNAPIGFFNIWEPIMFGLPIILNPLLIIPFILTGIWGATFAWIMVAIGWVTVPYVVIPLITPPIIAGFLATGGDWRSIPVQIVVLVGAFLIWYPFIRAWERTRAAENPDDVIS
jgi:PTS system cellobiose-specific IIC component